MGKDTIIAFDVNIDVSQNYQNGIKFILSVNTNNNIIQTSITKKWINENFQLVYYNPCNELTDYLTSEWGITNEISFSAPTCITDSPNIRYANSNFSSISTFTDISLKGATNAYLSFRARWDVEKGYDYVQVMGSKDNIDFIPLCGLYTTIGSASQAFNSPIYDGQQLDWVQEEISLEPFLGEENIYIKFEMFTDQGSNGDGFYFDDLLVNASFKPSNTENDKHQMTIAASPSLVKNGEYIALVSGSNPIPDNTTLTIRSANGKLISSQAYNSFINIPSDMTSGMYIITLVSNEGEISSTKFAVIE
jgi:carboxypeptidase T